VTYLPDQHVGREATQANANRYQDYISGGVAQQFRVAEPARSSGKVDYDGCKDTSGGPVLLEAKGSHLNKDGTSNIGKKWFSGSDPLRVQANEQRDTADRVGARLEWHVQTAADAAELIEFFKKNDVPVQVHHSPMANHK
jgi:Restriction endonuclease fold toxin 5